MKNSFVMSEARFLVFLDERQDEIEANDADEAQHKAASWFSLLKRSPVDPNDVTIRPIESSPGSDDLMERAFYHLSQLRTIISELQSEGQAYDEDDELVDGMNDDVFDYLEEAYDALTKMTECFYSVERVS